MGYVVAFLLLLAVAVVCVTGFFLVRVLIPDSPSIVLPSFITQTPSVTPHDQGTQPTTSVPTPGSSGQVQVAISPEQGYINTLITVTGQGWWGGEPVFVFLRSPEEGEGRGYAYAAAVADERGSFRTALTFPNEVRWIGQEWAEVIARGTRSGFEASTRFTLVVPTPTNTVPPPTPLPTRPPTNTPLPTDTPLPTNTPLPTATPTPDLVITEWRGEYFANTTVTGEAVLVRNDFFVDFNWGAGSPGAGIPADNFSARWTRFLDFREGTHRFSVVADDGIRFWIDGQLLVDEWHDSLLETYVVEVRLSKGSHALQVEYYERSGGAMVRLTWERIGLPTSTPSPTPTPTKVPSPTPTSTPSLPDTWRGEYYDNRSLSGEPVLVREDADVSFDWRKGSPGQNVPANNFSVRWTREVWLSAATYRVYVEADDGVRYWLDGQLLIDEWHEVTGETYMAEIFVPAGIHTVKVEYYEWKENAWIHLWGERLP